MGTSKKPGSKKTTYSRSKTSSKKKTTKRTKQDYELIRDIKIILAVTFSLFLFVCNFGIVGKFGNIISDFLFGVFGTMNYCVALIFAFIFIYYQVNAGYGIAVRKTIFSSILFFLICMVFDLIGGISKSLDKYDIKALYEFSKTEHKGGGVIASSLNFGLISLVDIVGTIMIIVALILICVILLTEKSFVKGVKNTTEIVRERTNEDRKFKEELYEERRQEMLLRKHEKLEREKQEKFNREQEAKEKKEVIRQAKKDDEILRKNQKVAGITNNTDLGVQNVSPANTQNVKKGDIHEIKLDNFDPNTLSFEVSQIPINGVSEDDEIIPGNPNPVNHTISPDIIRPSAKAPKKEPGVDENGNVLTTPAVMHENYKLPPMNLLNKGVKKAGDSAQAIRQTAQKLQDTLAIFGVEATVTDISQGPTVTRFELQPKMGVKVSRIKNLSDDIKLNLAASEIRIEAPIPGKAAIGIEVPNKESQPVFLRDLLESNEYKSLDNNLAFAVGKDITGKTIVYSINNFPHLLIAGATGAGKSVCINTMIMSILYKANPDDVKLIMIDPKVVELSVYNGIPHLLLPVVTDLKKAAATLNFAVNEMHERYNKFAEYGVRDIEGYTRAITDNGELEEKKMPHIVIIVDEVADLMLSERKNVEDAIQSLTQLARAAGIHLIIATQRPSVDVITGVIKANMPSRIAFAVSSNVDSRTILDMGGAEELLGKGDMLFFPKGLKKPVRLQGGFVSDKEVNDVCEFVRKQGTPSYDAMIEEKIKACVKKAESGASSSSSDDGGDGNDSLFADAGFYIIDNNKASIGMLQRKFKMGFNRAARIMDELAEAGVVGPDEGTKPRQIIMSHEQFENYLEEYGG